jgi:hypothetical protein
MKNKQFVTAIKILMLGLPFVFVSSTVFGVIPDPGGTGCMSSEHQTYTTNFGITLYNWTSADSVTIMANGGSSSSQSMANVGTGASGTVQGFAQVYENCSLGNPTGYTRAGFSSSLVFVQDNSVSNLNFFTSVGIGATMLTYYDGDGDNSFNRIEDGSTSNLVSGTDCDTANKPYCLQLVTSSDMTYFSGFLDSANEKVIAGTVPSLSPFVSQVSSSTLTTFGLMWPPNTTVSNSFLANNLVDFYAMFIMGQMSLINGDGSGTYSSQALQTYGLVCQNISGVNNHCPWFGGTSRPQPTLTPAS